MEQSGNGKLEKSILAHCGISRCARSVHLRAAFTSKAQTRGVGDLRNTMVTPRCGVCFANAELRCAQSTGFSTLRVKNDKRGRW
jgi:hypothetical protein